jgi:hypothetical protein
MFDALAAEGYPTGPLSIVNWPCLGLDKNKNERASNDRQTSRRVRRESAARTGRDALQIRAIAALSP